MHTLPATGSALLRTICERPEDDCARLVFADWLEEQGEGERAEFVRVQVAVEPWRSICAHHDGGRTKCPGCVLRRRERELLHHIGHWHAWTASIPTTDAIANLDTPPNVERDWSPRWWVRFRRGFIASVRTTAALWLAHGPAIVAVQPVERVRLSDWELLRPNNVPDPWPAWLGEFTPRLPSGMLTYEQDALDMLSAACVALARDRAGLPPRR